MEIFTSEREVMSMELNVRRQSKWKKYLAFASTVLCPAKKRREHRGKGDSKAY